jgi:large subunit ribosomal protein L5
MAKKKESPQALSKKPNASKKVSGQPSTKGEAKPANYVSLHDRLRGPIRAALLQELKVANTHALPSIEKVVVNVGINKTKMDSKELHEYIAESLGKITGQKPVFTRARVAISNFKTRKGLVVGAMVTLRGRRMEEFLDRLLSIALPRIRDFRGLSSKLDGLGNFAIGLRDHTIFPEISPPEAGRIFGMQIQISTTAKNDRDAMALFKQIGVPFKPQKSESSSKIPSPSSIPSPHHGS